MAKPKHEVADVIGQFQAGYERQYQPKGYVLKTFRALSLCRTAALGGHLDRCSDEACAAQRYSYNSCRNRHCGKCQGVQTARWLEKMQAKVLPVAYFHVVFTLPEQLNGLCLRYPKAMYDLLFRSAWLTIQGFAASKQYHQLQTGMSAVLHTWGQQLMLHPHVHCIVPAGGIDESGQWKALKGNGKYLYPVQPMKRVYRAKFVAGLRRLEKEGLIEKQPQCLYDALFAQEWVVFAKRPFGGADQVIEYLGRYTHKVAISNHRLVSLTVQLVSFRYKDYRQQGKQKVMTLKGEEFLRRFAWHILPKAMTKIRHFGLHSGALKGVQDQCYQQLTQQPRAVVGKKNWKEVCRSKLNFNPDLCPCCGKATMVTIQQWRQGLSPPQPEMTTRQAGISPI
jgi:hypothetical protein